MALWTPGFGAVNLAVPRFGFFGLSTWKASFTESSIKDHMFHELFVGRD
jgi:hypothetical protein